MKGTLETLSGLCMTATLLLAACVIFGLVMGDTPEEVAPLFAWGLCAAVLTWVFWGASKGVSQGKRD